MNVHVESGAVMTGPRSDVSRREFVLTGLAAVAGSTLPVDTFAQTAAGRSAFAQATADRSVESRDLTALTLKQASDLVRRGDVSPVELVEACLSRIDRHNPTVNAFITVTREQALAAARQSEGDIRRGQWRGPLHGIPIALKDNIDTAGVLTTAASGVFKDRVPDEDADVVVRLRKAGAVLVGKLNLHEFALGGRQRSPTSGRYATRGTWIASPADRPAARRRPSRPTCASGRSAPTPAARSAFPRRCAASWASSRRTGA
jgi:hypothetical protein